MSNTGNGRPVGTKKTVVEQGTAFKGTLSSSCPIVVMGKIDGEVTGPAVEVTETGSVSGKLKVSELRSRGELAGDFEAEEVELAGRVKDDTIIRAQTLVVALGKADAAPSAVFGDCEIQVGEAPSKERAVREALSGGRPEEPAVAVVAPPAPGAPSLVAAPVAEAAPAPVDPAPASVAVEASATPAPVAVEAAASGAPAEEPKEGGEVEASQPAQSSGRRSKKNAERAEGTS